MHPGSRSHPTPPWSAWLSLAAGASAIGLAPIFVRLVDTGPAATAGYRILFALPLLKLWALRSSRAPMPGTGPRPIWVILAGTFFAVEIGLWHASIRMTTVANATLLANLAPIGVAIGAWIGLGEKPRGGFWIGLGLGLLGAAALTGAHLEGHPTALAGDLLAMVTAVFYAAYQLCVKKLRLHLSAPVLLFRSGLLASPLLFLMAAIAGEPLLPSTRDGWVILLLLAGVSHVGGQGLIAVAFGHLTGAVTSAGLLLQPLVATLVAAVLFHEILSPFQTVGAGVLMIALYQITRPGSVELGRVSSKG